MGVGQARLSAREGYVSFSGNRTWCRVFGALRGGRLPLLCLHGGPGVPHDYLEPLAALAGGRTVVLYDQGGCGGSWRPRGPSGWTLDVFVSEVEAVRRALGLDRVHLFGHSWGGMLALEYLLRRPRGVCSLIAASTPASMAEWSRAAQGLRAALPEPVREVLARHEALGTTDDDAYTAAMLVYYQRHLCRLEPWPACLNRALSSFREHPEVYREMYGPSEFRVVGTLRSWDVSGRLGELSLPTLLTSGHHDEATREVVGTLHRGIAGSRWVQFERSSHMAHLEEPDAYLAVLESFLAEVEAR